MKRTGLILMVMSFAFLCNAQQTADVTSKNSWLKIGANAGVPVGNLSDYSNFTAGIELKGQLMQTNHFGLGLTTGYTHYFPKNNFDGFGSIPLGAFVRVYPKSSGFFAGLDGGYSFLTGANGADGGAYIKPQLGYHNYSWNYFAYYNNIFRSTSSGGSIGNVGVGVTYNVRFNKK